MRYSKYKFVKTCASVSQLYLNWLNYTKLKFAVDQVFVGLQPSNNLFKFLKSRYVNFVKATLWLRKASVLACEYWAIAQILHRQAKH